MSTTAFLKDGPGTTVQLATFLLGDLMLGIDIACIREITRVGDIAPVPDAASSVRGIANLRGEVVTVLDLRTILELEPQDQTSRSRLIILHYLDEHVGLLVDQVTDVLTVGPDAEEPLPANVAGVDSRFFTTVYKLDLELLVLLNVAAVLEPAVS